MSVYKTPLMESQDIDSLDYKLTQTDQNTASGRRHASQAAVVYNPVIPHTLGDAAKIDITDMNAATAEVIKQSSTPKKQSGVSYTKKERKTSDVQTYVIWTQDKSRYRKADWIGNASNTAVSVIEPVYESFARKPICHDCYAEYPLYTVRQEGMFPVYPNADSENPSKFMSLDEYETNIIRITLPVQGTLDFISHTTHTPEAVLNISQFMNGKQAKIVTATAIKEILYLWYEGQSMNHSVWTMPYNSYRVEAEVVGQILHIYNYSPDYQLVQVYIYLE